MAQKCKHKGCYNNALDTLTMCIDHITNDTLHILLNLIPKYERKIIEMNNQIGILEKKVKILENIHIGE